jgi:hypothetical protein
MLALPLLPALYLWLLRRPGKPVLRVSSVSVARLAAAKMAAERGVRIHVVGLGTSDGHAAQGDGQAIYLQLGEAGTRARQVVCARVSRSAVACLIGLAPCSYRPRSIYKVLPRIDAGLPGSFTIVPVLVTVTVSPSTRSTERSESRKLPT